MIAGKITKILTQKENDWGRYNVELADGSTKLAVGIIPGGAVGMEVTLEGEDVTNQYGRQYKITSVLASSADELAGLRQFLSGGYIKGIGQATAETLIATFGKDVLDMLETEEGQAQLMTVKGIKKKTVAKMAESYKKSKKYKEILVFLNGTGTKLQMDKILDKYGDSAMETLKKNPYQMQMDIDGFGFLKIDKIAMAAGIKADSQYRIMAAVKYIIENAQSAGGHCFLTMPEIEKEVLPLLAPIPKFKDISEIVSKNALVNPYNWLEAKEKLIKAHNPSMDTLNTLTQVAETRVIILNSLVAAVSDAIKQGSLVNDDGRIYTASMYRCEKETAELIAKMKNSHPVRFISASVVQKAIEETELRKTMELKKAGIHTEFKATKEQMNAAYIGLMNKIAIISGGPGRGKTAITEIIINAFISAGKTKSKDDVLILAPTGRAAQRVTESTGFPASTIHRTIYKVEETSSGLRFCLRKDIPSGQLIICDESSMIDIWLARDLLSYARNCNLIFVGDVDQIASVGAGKVLKDLISSECIPCAMLKEGHRNSGSIAHNADLINAGLPINKYCYDEHFVYIPSTADHIAKDICNDYVKKVREYGIKNVMLCTAMRERGAVAVNTLNSMLQGYYTKGQPEAKFGENRLFRIGDRVMQTCNDYQIELRDEKNNVRSGVFNGERGTVTAIHYDTELESLIMKVTFDDGFYGLYDNTMAHELTLAYATTLHKCQGSEAACMMMAYTFGDYILLNKALFYTGETRAKKEFRFYGEEKWQYGKMVSAFDIAVSKQEDSNRHTNLAERIRKAVDRG